MKITNRFATEDYVTIATGEKITSPFTGLVGQTIVVKEIDENGRPIKWECVDISSGGNGGSGLPPVTEADNGKVLTVVNGVWTAVELPNAEEASF